MGKRERSAEPPRATDAAPLRSSPFAGLAGLAAAAPAKAAPEAAEKAPSPAGSPPDRAAAFPDKVVLRHERKGRGGKTITRVAGVPAARRDELAAELKRALGCGGVVEGDDVVLLGAVAERAAEWLRGRGARRVVVGN